LLKKRSIYPGFLLFLLCSAVFAQETAQEETVPDAGQDVIQEAVREIAQETGQDVMQKAEQETKQEPSKNLEAKKHFEQSKSLSQNITQLSGIALEPTLVVGAMGAYKYLTSSKETKELLPWYCMPWFWIVCLILYLVLHSPTALSAINLPSQISSALKACDKQIGLLVTSPVVVDQVMDVAGTLSAEVAFSGAQPSAYLSASIIPLELLSGLPTVFWFIAIVPMLFFVFFSMWLLNFVFDMLVFLSPFGFVDAALEFFRIAFYAILLAVAIFIPQLVFVLIIPIAVISVIMFGWSIRRCVMGFVFFKDFINRKKESSINEKGIVAFAGQSLGFPNKCCVKIIKKDENLQLSYKRLFLFKKTKTIDNPELTLKRGVLYSGLYNNGTFICTLPLRYQKIMEKVQTNLNIHKIEDSYLKKGITGMVEWTKDIFGKK